MKTYLRLKCTTCKRVIDRAVDNSRFQLDKCIITLNCQGKLLPLEYRSNGDIATTPEVGLTDWFPRGQTVESNAIVAQTPTFIDTATGLTQQLVMAVRMDTAPAANATALLTLNVRANSPKTFRQYTFRFETTFSIVSGVETATARKTLRFTAYGADPDLVEVYVNGVKLEQGVDPDQYQIYDGVTSSLAPNTIYFNTPIALTGTTQVDVIVSKAQTLNTRTLQFTKSIDNPTRTPTGAWENVDYFKRYVGGVERTFYLFYYDVANTPDIDLNTILAPAGDVLVDNPLTSVPLTSCFFMLARKPYSTLDRYPDTMVPLSTMSLDRDYLKYHKIDGQNTLVVAQTALFATYPPARLSKFDPEPTIKTRLAGVEGQLTIDGQVIVGPDT